MTEEGANHSMTYMCARFTAVVRSWGIAFFCIIAFGGCTTTPKDFSTHSDDQLLAEYDRISQRIAIMENQYRKLMNDAAYSITQEEAVAANFGAAITAAQLEKLYADRNSAIAEAERRSAERPASSPALNESATESAPSPSTAPKSVTVPEPPSGSASLPSYTGPSDGHWISQVFSSGRYVLLEDSSVWEIDSIDTIDSTLWLSMETVVVASSPYKGYVFYDLINTDSGDKVHATYIGQVVLHTHIQDEFEGWDGETVFTLDTGNVLQQASYAYTYHYAYRPEVLVLVANGCYRLMVDGVEETISVVVLK